MMVMLILGLIPICFVGVRDWYRSWLSKKRRQVDLGAHAFPLRLLYWISQHLDMRTIFRALR